MEQNEIQGVQYEGILAKGYGLIPQLVTRDKDLSIEAKAIYGYLAAFAGTTGEAFPGVALICEELNISKKRYLSHRKALIEKGYIEIKRERLESGFSKNLYILKQNIPYRVDSLPYDSLPYQNVGLQDVTIQNDTTISNSIKNNNLINNKDIKNNNMTTTEQSSLSSEIFKFYESEFGPLSNFIAEELGYMIEETNEELTLEALKLSVRANKRTIKYAAAITRNWRNENIQSLDDLRAAQKAKGRGRDDKNDRRSVRSAEEEDYYSRLSNFSSDDL
ncbi:DnaD domain protein [Kurthia gibsonii]|uniref:DnaD domain protein n=1 Tax=Kurthia gibsonii TaxID=33946 RepID=UPI003016F1D2